MSVLPTVAPHTPTGLRITSPRTPRTMRTFNPRQHSGEWDDQTRFGGSAKVPVMFKRLFKFSQMDFELAAWQLTYLCVAPRRVYKNVYFHKQTKNTWARDDPAILWLISATLCVSAIAWGLVYSMSPLEIIKLAILMILRDFLLVGAAVATLVWLFANTLLLSNPTPLSLTSSQPSISTAPAQRVEWAYAFDVHCNALFPVILVLHGAQLVLLPVVSRDGWVWMWLGNSVWVGGLTQYIYITYLGLNALPFLIRTELLLFPLLPLFAAYAVSLLGFNVARWALQIASPATGQDFIDALIEDNKELWDRFQNHPFPAMMGNGSASLEGFKNYMIQDFLYLRGYLRFLFGFYYRVEDWNILSEDAPEDITEAVEYANAQLDACTRDLGVPKEDVLGTALSPVIKDYLDLHFKALREESWFRFGASWFVCIFSSCHVIL
ncbi:UNC-50 family protein [Ceratobasidium sp. AG-Ba]|nr:UNC-50 family protein [Ceratobasidium sp. AG-Ba]